MLRNAFLLVLLHGISSFGQNFTTRWDTNITENNSSANNQITIPTSPAFTYDYTVNWGDGNTDTNVTGRITHDYATPGIYTVEISGTFPAIFFNNERENDKLKIIEILSWGTNQWQTMENAFYGCQNMNFDSIDAPDLSQVNNLQNMFRGCLSFNGIVNNWDVSTISNMANLFYDCRIFNRPLDSWQTANVTNMSGVFYNCYAFNEPLDNWNTASVTNMNSMFSACVTFNQNINNWNVSQVTDMANMFLACTRFNQPLNNWDVSQVTDMSVMFFRTRVFDQDLSGWQVGNVTNMQRMFDECAISYTLNTWDVSNVTNMSGMFDESPNYNQPLNNWDVSKVTDMSGMFRDARVFNQNINDWDVSNVENMASMFQETRVFNSSLDNWDVSSVKNMSSMFYRNVIFNQDISNWNVSAVENMTQMFRQATAFNQPLDSWNVTNVTNTSAMFYEASAFNQPLNSWNMTGKSSLQDMFRDAVLFNQDISNWNTSGVTNMTRMFNGATAFNYNLANWNISGVSLMDEMLSGSGLSQENYDNTLIGWSGQTVQDNVNLGSNGLQYCDALNQRQGLIDTYGWNITGDAVNCSFVLCTNITMPTAGDTMTPANSDIRWAPAPNATGYRVTLEIERGGNRNFATINGNVADNYDVGNVVGLSFTNEFLPGDVVYVTVVPYNSEGPATGCSELSFTVIESWVNRPDAFKLTYDTRILESGSTPDNQLKIETNTGFPDYLTYNYSIDWGDGQYNNNVTGNITHTYLNPGIYTISIIGDFPAPYHWVSNSDHIKLISIDQWGTQVWQSMQYGFYGCENMEYNATDVPNLSQVENMANMFSICRLFNGSISNWDVSNVTNMSSLFISARTFNQPLNSWDTSNVTNMNGMFGAATEFNQPLNTWDVSQVTNMNFMFAQTENFDQDLSNWDTRNVMDMARMFQSSKAFNQPLNSWNVERVTDMSEMFQRSEAFNQPLNSWNTSNVENMSAMFYSADVFNQNINDWNVAAVTDMSQMFFDTPVFNQPLNNWDVSSVTTMQSMFSRATVFNQNIDSWNVTNVTNMSFMFDYAGGFNQPLNNWNVNSVVNMRSMFRGAELFNQPLSNWDVSAVSNMSQMFESAVAFNQPIDSWNVSSVTLMLSMFENAEVFDQNLNNWNVAVVTNFDSMFKNAPVFNQPLNSWDTGEVQNMQEMFYGAELFNQDIANWNTSFVTTMREMFREASAFNQNLDSWNVASVTTMQGMFKDATAFNGSINDWNVRAVTTMQDMFSGATSFNQSVNNWRVSRVANMDGMFRESSALNQSFNQWLLGSVSMREMFRDATSFNQYLGDWNIENVSNMENMLDDTAITLENYDNTLITWSEQNVTPGINLGANSLLYCDAVEERESMITNFGWTFTGDILDCPTPECTQLVAPLNGAIDVPVNSNLAWNAVTFAREYKLFVGTSSGGTDILNGEVVVNDTFFEFAADFTPGVTVYVTIIPSNESGDAIGPCTEESFTIANNAAAIPDCTSLTFPLNNTTDIRVDTDISWDVIANADGYLLNVGTTPNGTEILNNEDVGNVMEFDFATDLPEDTLIYITILPYNTEGSAISCAEESFRTEVIPVPPVCTTLINPTNNATDVPIDTQVSWNAVPDATGYLLSVGITSGGIEVLNSIDVGNITTYTFGSNLQADRIHYVRITPYNTIGDATACIEEQFRTGTFSLSDPPSCSNLTSPLNGATDIALGTNITWNSLANTDGYFITIGTTSGGNDILDNQDVGNTTTYDLPTDLPENREIFVTIVPYNDNGNAVGCAEESFTTTTLPTVPNCTNLTVPLNTATDISVSTDLTWNAVGNADDYLLTIGTTSGGNDILDNQVVNGTSFDLPTDLPENNQIFVTIVPTNAVGSATGCSEESFSTETLQVAPNCTSLTAPLNNATNVSIFTNIFWNSVPNATGYFISVGTSSGGTDIADNVDVANAITYDIPVDLPFNTEIFVTINPYNTAGTATGCTEESFTTETELSPPPCSLLMSPANGDTDIPITIDNIAWNPIANVDGYFLSITGSSSTVNNLVNQNITTGAAIGLPGSFDAGETVTVLIVPYNAAGQALGCTEQSFTIKGNNPVPECTSLLLPLSGETNVSTATNLTWNPATNADGYLVTVGTTSGGNDVLNAENVVGTSFDLPTDLPERNEIFVTIVPYNTNGNAVGCAEESFTTEILSTPPGCTNLTNPVDLSIDVPVNTNISWNTVAEATGYRLAIGSSAGLSDIFSGDVGNITTLDLPENLPKNTEIFVLIVPYNDAGNAEMCTEQVFITGGIPLDLPTCTTLASPENESTNVSVNTSISWRAVGDVDGYIVTLGTTTGGTDILEVDAGLTTSYQLSENLPFGQEIFATIIPYNEDGRANSCESQSFRTVLETDEIESLFGFSPDGDGNNDFWTINGIEEYPNNTVMIFNRWGDLVFSIEGYDNNSNIFRGEANQLIGLGAGQLPEGTYFFQINIPTEHNLKATQGYLVLKR